ncbi:hypothetical protein K437DRAFT_254008 [Tilletiaria anomala UBC 951]|uniref:Small-subunit processome Utp12 domain-containing protein n=1 Tax=Tilletiaria anomala (strain ATCC 24038 / CBS 436.72 / UBC 951) TaxID=1037660 RepID=A0A066WPQ4_TILAU|nr:uncharacterized protein K437DRAFT_254008 [Tilletiaria anomala UBC 951]KDN52605.1 hypothetical protein K437DRAFT_254008 [Tilletiaria anomala UBC 951]
MASISQKNASGQKGSSKRSSGKSRPASTSSLNALSASASTSASSAAALDELAAAGVLSAFSPLEQHSGRGYFALLSQAIDRHRLRIYAVSASEAGATGAVVGSSGGRLVADYIIPNEAKCNTLAWGRLSAGSSAKAVPNDQQADTSTDGSKKKKRRKSKPGNHVTGEDSVDLSQPNGSSEDTQLETQVLALGLDNGQVHLFSPSLGKTTHILSDSEFSAASHGIHATTLPLASAAMAGTGRNKGVLHVVCKSHHPLQFWTASSDGVVRVYELETQEPLHGRTIAPSRRIVPEAQTGVHIVAPADAPVSTPLAKTVLVGHHSIRLFPASTASKASSIPASFEQPDAPLVHFTGHATPITHLVWLSGDAAEAGDQVEGNGARFVSAAEEDRTLYIWDIPSLVPTDDSGVKNGKPLALITLDSAARHIECLQLAASQGRETGEQLLLIVTSSGSAQLYSIPTSFDAAATTGADAVTATDASGLSTKKKKRRASALAALPTLKPVSQVRIVSSAKGSTGTLPLVDAVAAAESTENGGALSLLLARLVRGSKLVLERAVVRPDAAAPFASQLELTRSGDASNLLVSLDDGSDAALGGGVSPMQRFDDGPSTSAVAAGGKQSVRAGSAAGAALSAQLGLVDGSSAIPKAEELDALIDEQAELGIDLDEPTLAQRLKSLNVRSFGQGAAGGRNRGKKSNEDAGLDNSDEDEDADDAHDSDDDGFGPASKTRALTVKAGGSASLAQALTQALHSGDTTLLTSSLVHGDPVLIRGTVARLSGPLAVRLLEHCIERMNKGGNMTSRGALGSQRAKALIEWVRITLVIHTAYFMSLPNLVTRLFHLHSALLARLASQDKLLELQGRLELVLAQIELRATYDASQVDVQGVKARAGAARAAASKGGSKKESRKQALDRTQGQVWVESDAEEEAETDAMNVDEEGDDDDDDVERGDEEGELQDIALGGDEDDSEEEESESEDEEDEDEVMEDNAVVDTPEGSEEGSGDERGDAAEDQEEEEYDEDADEAGSLDDFIVDDDEEALDQEGDSDDEDESEDDDEDEGKLARHGRHTARQGGQQQKHSSMLVDDEAEETSGEGTGPDEDSVD